MAEFSSHAPGTFSWAELATTDQKGGVQFYRSLFGWDVNEQPISDNEVYTMFTLRGKEVAAGYTMRPEERQHGAPPYKLPMLMRLRTRVKDSVQSSW
jgi:predicted enzyme related to lactoylglutathione lyase